MHSYSHMDHTGQPVQPRNAYKWQVVGMLWCVCVLNYADRQAIFAVFPKLQEEFGFDKVQLGLIGSAFMWVYAAGAPFAGAAGDQFSRKGLILGGCIFWSAVTAMTGWCSKLWHFVTVRALEGFGETFYFPASMSLISDYHRESRSRAMSLHQSSVYVGSILGSWLGAYLAEKYNWRLGFYIFGAAGIILAIILFRLLKEPLRTSDMGSAVAPAPWWPAIKAMFANPAAVLIMCAFVGANFVATIFLTWTPTFLVEKFGFRLTSAGLSGSVFIFVASALSAPMGGVFADHFAKRFMGGRMFVQIAGLLVGSVFVFFVGRTGEVSTLLAAMVGFGLCKGLYDSNIFAAILDVVHPSIRSSAVGIMNTVGWGGGALGPVAVGWFSEHGGGSQMENMSKAISLAGLVYVASAAILVAAVVCVSRAHRRKTL